MVLHLGFEDYIVTGDAEIDVTLSDKRRDVRGRKKNPESLGQSLQLLGDSGDDTNSARLWFSERQTSRR